MAIDLTIPSPTLDIPAGPHDDRSFEIDGRRLSYPARFANGRSIMGLFSADLSALNRQIAASGFVAAEVLPAKGLVSIVCVRYTDTDCGTYEEICWGCFVEPRDRPAGRRPGWTGNLGPVLSGSLPSYTWRLAVTTTLSRDAGLLMWGYPKTLEDLVWTESENSARMSWRIDGREIFAFTAPTSGRRRPAPISPEIYSIFEGAPHVGNLTQAYADTGYHPRRGRLLLGQHPIAAELAGLGLGSRPLVSVSNGHLAFEMSAPRPV